MFILASRLSPDFAEASAGPATSRPGVQQILLLPRVGKACVRCNSSATFYSLPELSPVFNLVRACHYIGGVDLNDGDDDGQSSDTITMLMSFNKTIQVAEIGQSAAFIKVFGIMKLTSEAISNCGLENQLPRERRLHSPRLDSLCGRLKLVLAA